MSLLSSFRAARWVRTINLILQAALLISLLGGLNYLAVDYYGRFDLTRLRKHSLSPETRSYLEHLSQPVNVIVTKPDDPNDAEAAQAQRDVTELLQEYVYVTEHSSGAKISVIELDIYQRTREAKQLGLEHPNTVTFLSNGKRMDVPTSKLYVVNHKQRTAFIGERIFTEMVLDVANFEKKKIYFLTGHGEMDWNKTDALRGLSTLRDGMRENNFELIALDLSQKQKIPDDAAVVLSVGATDSYEPYEQEMLRQYLTRRAGRLMLLISPGVNPTGLETLFWEWGVVVDDDYVRDNDSSGKSDNNELVLRSFDGGHPITKPLNGTKLLVFGATRSVHPNPSSDETGLTVTRLVTTTEGGVAVHNSATFTPGRLSVATASERVKAKDNLRFSVKGGRLVIFGCSDFVANGRYATRSNGTIFLYALNWLADREAELNVPPRPIEKFQLTLSSRETLQLRYALLFVLPGIACLLGFIVYLTRRS